MKKILITGLLSLVINLMFAQDVKKAEEYLKSKQLDKAKTEIDAFVLKNPTDAEGLYLKCKIYGALPTSDQFKNDPTDFRMEAFQAFKKAMENDKGNKMIFMLSRDQYKPIFDIYTGYFDAGAALFNTGAQKNDKALFEQSMNMFKNANVVGQYVFSQKWALSKIDTALVLTIAKAAINAGKKDESVTWLKILADAKIKGTRDDKAGYMLPYQWLTFYYKDNKDEANMQNYAALGKEVFPKDDYYDAVILDFYRERKDYDKLFKKYDEVVTSFPDSLQYHFNYANEAFQYVYNSDAGTKIANKDALLKSIGEQIQKALAINPNSINVNWLAGQYYYNQGVDVKDLNIAIKGTKPEDVKKKADLNAQTKDYFNKAIPYGEKALGFIESNGFKKSDKSKYKSIVDLMQRIYQGLNMSDKVKLYQAKYDGADAKFVN